MNLFLAGDFGMTGITSRNYQNEMVSNLTTVSPGTVYIVAKPAKRFTFDTFFDNVSFDTDVAMRFIKFSDLGNFFSWKYRMDYDILSIEETDIGGVENG